MKTLFAILFSLSVFGQATDAFGFGAIAYSGTTGRWGTSWNQPTLGQAEWVARANCVAYDCRTAVWVQNGCAALAVGSFRPWLYGYGYASFAGQAELNALIQCNRADVNCRTLASVCTF